MGNLPGADFGEGQEAQQAGEGEDAKANADDECSQTITGTRAQQLRAGSEKFFQTA